MTEDALARLVSSFRGRRVLVVGDVMLDEYLWGDVRRISPEAPVPIVELRRRSYRPGGAANVAANIRRLGGDVLLAGIVGPDPAAASLRQALTGLDVDSSSLLADDSRPTTAKTRVIAHDQQVVRIDDEERRPIDAGLVDKLSRWALRQLAEVDVCVLSDYAKGVVTAELAAAVIGRARQLGKPVVVDPKGDCFHKYKGATVAKPNVLEAAAVLKRPLHNEADLLHAGGQLVQLLDGTSMLLTRGAEGMTLFQAGQAPHHIAAVARHVYDVTGAGDTVIGVLALGLAAGASLEATAWASNRAAGVVVGKVGTTTVSVAELLGAGT